MDVFPIIVIIVVTIIVISIIVVIIILVTNNNNTNSTTATHQCTTQADCGSGYVCSGSVCKAGLGIPCNDNSDCIPELVCKTGANSEVKVCSEREIIAQDPIPSRVPVPIATNAPRRRVSWAKDPPINIPATNMPTIPPTNIVPNPVTNPIDISAFQASRRVHPRGPQILPDGFAHSINNGTMPPINPGQEITGLLGRLQNPNSITPISGEPISPSNNELQLVSRGREFGTLNLAERSKDVPDRGTNFHERGVNLSDRSANFHERDIIEYAKPSGRIWDPLGSRDGGPIPFNLSQDPTISDMARQSIMKNSFQGDLGRRPVTPLSSDILPLHSRMDASNHLPLSSDIAPIHSRREPSGHPPSSDIFTIHSRRDASSHPPPTDIFPIHSRRDASIHQPPSSDIFTLHPPLTGSRDGPHPEPRGLHSGSPNEMEFINIARFRTGQGSFHEPEIVNHRSMPLQSPDQSMLRRHRIMAEISSTDDEINSDGRHTDAPFDIRSGESTDAHPISSVSTPCAEKDGVYYCRNNPVDTVGPIAGDSENSSPVIDVCSYSTAVVFLLEDGHIICENTATAKRYRTNNNVQLCRIVGFSGYLYGVGVDQHLYTLPNTHFSTNNWNWTAVAWFPGIIQHICTTHDGSYLWIQTETTGYLYHTPNQVQLKQSCRNVKRVYGRDADHYLEINLLESTATIYPEGKVVQNVYDGALSFYDEVIAIHPSESREYRGITIVNWQPYYIRT